MFERIFEIIFKLLEDINADIEIKALFESMDKMFDKIDECTEEIMRTTERINKIISSLENETYDFSKTGFFSQSKTDLLNENDNAFPKKHMTNIY